MRVTKKKKITGSLIVFLLTTRLKIKMHTIFLIILTLVEFSSSKKSIISLRKNKKMKKKNNVNITIAMEYSFFLCDFR